jgi:hypothetical protein
MLAAWLGGAWVFIEPRPGWRAVGLGDGSLRLWSGTDWLRPGLDNLDGLGIGTAHDATNRLAVSSPATLLTHAGSDHRLLLNKAAVIDTASLLFQSGWSGRAEMGLAGDDDFAVKVSADGSTWTEALRVTAATGAVNILNGAQIDGTLMGTAVTQSNVDTTAGRLLKVGDFGNGALGPQLTDLTAAIAPGRYWFIESTAIGSPNTGPFQATLEVTSTAAGQTFLARRVSSTLPRLWSGSRSGSTGSITWTELYSRNSILGTVSQTGGVPTGAVIERGSNANGSYVRFADGTQICTNSNLATSASADTAWTFPATFQYPANPNRPVVSGNVATTVSNGHRLAISGLASGTSIFVNAINISNARVAATAHLTAIGRWF